MPHFIVSNSIWGKQEFSYIQAHADIVLQDTKRGASHSRRTSSSYMESPGPGWDRTDRLDRPEWVMLCFFLWNISSWDYNFVFAIFKDSVSLCLWTQKQIYFPNCMPSFCSESFIFPYLLEGSKYHIQTCVSEIWVFHSSIWRSLSSLKIFPHYFSPSEYFSCLLAPPF